jgi:hypothetical protein
MDGPPTSTAAFLIGATIKVKLKASKYDSTSQILFFSPNEERSSRYKFLKKAHFLLFPVKEIAPPILHRRRRFMA